MRGTLTSGGNRNPPSVISPSLRNGSSSEQKERSVQPRATTQQTRSVEEEAEDDEEDDVEEKEEEAVDVGEEVGGAKGEDERLMVGKVAPSALWIIAHSVAL